MGYNTKKIIGDVDTKPVPQYFNKQTDAYEVVTGADGAHFVQLPPVTDFANGAVTVGATAIELKAGATALAGRKQLIVYPPTAGTIYWGKSGVTSATGAPLKAGDQPLVFDFNPNIVVPIYAVNDGTNRDIRVVESK